MSKRPFVCPRLVFPLFLLVFVTTLARASVNYYVALIGGLQEAKPELLASSGSASDIYIAQSGAGANSGASCADAHAVSFFNNSQNWGTAAGQIGPGTVVHLCGTILAPAGSYALNVLGSGSSTSPIEILFESGVEIQSPYGGSFNALEGRGTGMINVNNVSNVIVDGGTDGIIENTANGTDLVNHQSSVGVYLHGSNLTVRNLTIKSIYVNNGSSKSATDTAGYNSSDIAVGGHSSDISIYNCTLQNASINISSNTTGNEINYYNNTLSDAHWFISATGAGQVDIHNNNFGSQINWDYPDSTYHTDGIITWGDSSQIVDYIYNNAFIGDMGDGSPTAEVFCTYGISGNGSGSSCYIFNNLFVGTGATENGAVAIWFGFYNPGNPLGPYYVYNNTFVGFSNQIFTADPRANPEETYALENNIFVGGTGLGTYFIGEDNSTPFSALTSNYNDFHQGRTYGPWNWGSPGGVYGTLSAWQKASGGDLNSSTGNPTLSSDFVPQAGSSAIGLGRNLSSLCSSLPALCKDKAGNSRPSSGHWDAGAYNSGSNPSASVVSVSLVEASNAKAIAGYSPVTSGQTIYLDSLPTSDLSLFANTKGTIGSIFFSLDGTYTHTENTAPYSMCGDQVTSATECSQLKAVGNHTLTVSAYGGADKTGSLLNTMTVNFTVSSSKGSISGVNLVAASNVAPLSGFDPMAEGATITLADLSTKALSLFAVPVSGATIGSVVFSLDGTYSHIESQAPYSMCGDQVTSATACSQLNVVGTHNLTLKVYSGSGGTGTLFQTYNLGFSIK